MSAQRFTPLFVLPVASITQTEAQWTHVAGLANVNVSSFASKGSVMFAGTDSGGIYRSTDAGLSWSSADSGVTSLQYQASRLSEQMHLREFREPVFFVRPMVDRNGGQLAALR